MSCTVTMTREEQVSTLTQQVPRAVNADRVTAQRQRVESQREHAQKQLYTSSQPGREWTYPWW